MTSPSPSGMPRRDPHWLEHVRSLRCTLCGHPGGEAHHVRIPGYCGTALKPPDCLAVPICRACHQRLHTEGYGDARAAVDSALVYLLMEYMERSMSAEEEF